MELKLDYRDPRWVAARLGLDKNTIYRLLQDGTLPAVQIGRKWLISESRLAEYLEEQTGLQTTLRRMIALPSVERVMERTRTEAAKYRHAYIGQEHILLALTVVEGAAKDALSQLGAEEAKVRCLFEAELRLGDRKPRGKCELTPRARRAVCLAAEEARRAGRVAYGPEHLLVGLLRTNEGMGFQMLSSLGVNLDAVRAIISPDSPSAKPSEPAEDSEQTQ